MTERTLTKRQFLVLAEIEKHEGKCSQRSISDATNFAIGTINKTMNELRDLGYVKDKNITEAGLAALEPYRVQRAVFLAAGFGSRMVPITLNTPKPLVRVKGTRIIDTLLDAVVAAGITEIYLVRGYLGEQFSQLTYKYPTIKFIENPIFNESNNISSIACASYFLQNAYVLESDFLLSNPEIITKYQYESNYLGIPMEMSEDWCFETDKDGEITCVKVGGKNCHQMVGVSYWTNEDGAKLVGHINEAYHAPGGKERYWDLVPLEIFKGEYNVHVRECKQGDIVEIDTFNELKAIDPSYAI